MRSLVYSFLLILIPSQSLSQSEGGSVSESDLDNANLSEEAEQRIDHNLKIASAILGHRARTPAVIKEKGTYFGPDLTMVKVPDGATSGAVAEAVARYILIPLPTFNFDVAKRNWQDNYSFFYITASPVANVTATIAYGRLGRDFYLSSKRQAIVGLKLGYTQFAALRKIEILGEESIQGVSLTSYGAQMVFSYQTKTDLPSLIPQIALGYSQNDSFLRVDTTGIERKYQEGIPYVSLGLSLCSGAKQFCTMLEAHMDQVVGPMLTATAQTRL